MAVSAPIAVRIGKADVPIALLLPVVVKVAPSAAVRFGDPLPPLPSVIAPTAVSSISAAPAFRAPSGMLPVVFARVMKPSLVLAFSRVAFTLRGVLVPPTGGAVPIWFPEPVVVRDTWAPVTSAPAFAAASVMSRSIGC